VSYRLSRSLDNLRSESLFACGKVIIKRAFGRSTLLKNLIQACGMIPLGLQQIRCGGEDAGSRSLSVQWIPPVLTGLAIYEQVYRLV
jgi:hypothetical protein